MNFPFNFKNNNGKVITPDKFKDKNVRFHLQDIYCFYCKTRDYQDDKYYFVRPISVVVCPNCFKKVKKIFDFSDFLSFSFQWTNQDLILLSAGGNQLASLYILNNQNKDLSVPYDYYRDKILTPRFEALKFKFETNLTDEKKSNNPIFKINRSRRLKSVNANLSALAVLNPEVEFEISKKWSSVDNIRISLSNGCSPRNLTPDSSGSDISLNECGTQPLQKAVSDTNLYTKKRFKNILLDNIIDESEKRIITKPFSNSLIEINEETDEEDDEYNYKINKSRSYKLPSEKKTKRSKLLRTFSDLTLDKH